VLAVVTPGGHGQLSRFIFPAFALLNAVAAGAVVRAMTGPRTEPSPAPRGKAGRDRAAVPPGAVSAGRNRAAVAGGAALASVAGLLAFRVPVVVTWNEEDHVLRGREYLSGRTDAEGYRRSLMGSCGQIQPGVARLCAGGGREAVLVIGAKFFWGAPARILTNEMGLRPVWDAVAASSGPGRLAVRFRQMGVRWLVYDADYAAWDRTVPASYPWDDRRLRVYAAFAMRHFRVETTTACRCPGFGMHWLIEVTRRPHAPSASVPVLPGDRKSTRLNSSHRLTSRMPSSA
jgi:hypothetical protein